MHCIALCISSKLVSRCPLVTLTRPEASIAATETGPSNTLQIRPTGSATRECAREPTTTGGCTGPRPIRITATTLRVRRSPQRPGVPTRGPKAHEVLGCPPSGDSWGEQDDGRCRSPPDDPGHSLAQTTDHRHKGEPGSNSLAVTSNQGRYIGFPRRATAPITGVRSSQS